MELTQNLLRELFDYRDGNLYWKVRKAICIHIGDKAGTLNKRGYYRISINGKLYYNHRVIFLYHYGYLPKYLDHIDRNPLNNKIENLREVTHSQNCMNQKSTKNSTSEYKGVSWYKSTKKWVAHIRINGKSKTLGYFVNDTEAAKAYNKAAIKAYGEFAHINKL